MVVKILLLLLVLAIYMLHTQRTFIVVGSGLAGLSASATILQSLPSAKVFILEQSSRPGGNSIKASSGINGAGTRFQTWQDMSFEADTIKSAGKSYAAQPGPRTELIRTMCSQSNEAVEWLTSFGIDLSKVTRLGGHSVARTHRGKGPTPPGASIVSTLLKYVSDKATLQVNCEVTRLLTDKGRVVGVEYNNSKRLYGSVIFTTGGFAGSEEYLSKYAPQLVGLPSTNTDRPGTQHLLTEIGAELVDMGNVQVHPTGFVDPNDREAKVKFLAAEALRGEGGILVDDVGDRFVSELATRLEVTERVMKATKRDDTAREQYRVFLVLDEGAYSAIKPNVDFYMFKGLMKKTTASESGLPNLLATLKSYGESEEFKRPRGHWTLQDASPDSVVYVGQVTPVVHFTMGGVRFNSKAQPLSSKGNPIEGIWVAGEITGGIHGDNRLGGSSLLECCVYGRVAAKEALQ